MGAGDDRLTRRELAPVRAGDREDRAGRLGRDQRSTARGARTTLSGGSRDDTLPRRRRRRGRGRQRSQGCRGTDLLRGSNRRDLLDGGPGNDTLRGGDGRDSFFGGEGDDLLHGGLNGDGPDTFIGGPGTDTVTYAFAGAVTVTIFDPANVTASEAPDGEPGEGDVVQGDVENVTGGASGDTLTGNNLANRIDRSLGDDTIAGRDGRTVPGRRGDDATTPVTARPTRSSTAAPAPATPRPWTWSPAPPGANRAHHQPRQLRERPLPRHRRRPPRHPWPRASSGRNAAGIATVRLTCPKNARVTCRGTLRLRQLKAPRKVLRSKRYEVRRGTTGEILLNVPASLRGRRAVARDHGEGRLPQGPPRHREDRGDPLDRPYRGGVRAGDYRTRVNVRDGHGIHRRPPRWSL